MISYRSDENIRTNERDPGSYFNVSREMILLRMPTAIELRRLWKDFDRELRGELKELLLSPYGEVVQRLGRLGFRRTTAEHSSSELYGMLKYGEDVLVHFPRTVLTQAAAKLGVIPPSREALVGRLTRGMGKITPLILSLPQERQEDVIREIVDNWEDLDSWIRVAPNFEVGWKYLKRLVSKEEPVQILNAIAADLDVFMRKDIQSAEDGDGFYIYSSVWFAQYLCMRGVWLWPPDYVTRISHIYPERYSPLILRMSLPRHRRDLADAIYKFHQTQKGTSAAMTLRACGIALLTGNSFSSDAEPLHWFPLVALKERTATLPSPDALSSSINAIYRLAVERSGQSVKGRPEAHFFVNSARLARVGTEPFTWVFHPTPFNTRLASRLLGKPVEEAPDYVKEWARILRHILPLFGVKHYAQVEGALNFWLIYLISIDGVLLPPVDFATILRQEHVHDLSGQNDATFWNFLNALPKEYHDRANRAIAQMRKAFGIAAQAYRITDATNPFDTKLDRIGGGYKGRGDVTVRSPLPMEVWEVITRKNREGGYAYARSLGPIRCHQELRDPKSGEPVNVFWPAEAVAVDIILNSGMRHVSARWVDSGEGDEFVPDVDLMEYRKNSHPSATVGRKDCFLQIVDLPGREGRRVVGQRVGINKSGKPFVIPWVDPGIVDAFKLMQSLQKKYNPIASSVKPIKRRTLEITRANSDLYPDIFPLLRDPKNDDHHAVSEYKVLAYWKDLLVYCQADINKLLGRDFPLFNGNAVLFDLHSLRVTMVSNLLEAGVDVSIVKDLMGHSAWVMTWYYNGFRSSQLNAGIQKAMQARGAAHDALASGDEKAIHEYADEAVVHPDLVENHVGVRMLRGYAANQYRAPFEIFSHGICPGGSCSTGGEKISGQRFGPVWRERACSGCRYRVTGPKFRNGIQNKINNLLAELRMVERRVAALSAEIEASELESGKRNLPLRTLQESENGFKDQLSKELSLELHVHAMVNEAARIAEENGSLADRVLLPAASSFDPESLGYGFAEVSEFELFHMLVKETRILPASIMEIPQGVEAEMKKQVKRILRRNGMWDLLEKLTDHQETEACLRVGDVILEHYPGVSEVQQLLEGVVKLNGDLIEEMKKHVVAAISASDGHMRSHNMLGRPQ
jgi:hypothetical protein